MLASKFATVYHVVLTDVINEKCTEPFKAYWLLRCTIRFNIEQVMQCTYNLALRRVRATIVAVEKE
jgi:hypothetical protein